MAAARERAARVIPGDLELPVLDSPQYVNEDGYEVDAQTFAQALQQAAVDLSLPLDGLHGQSDARAEAQDSNADAEPTQEDGATGHQGEMPEGNVENGEPLLSLSERYVQSLRIIIRS